MDVGSFIVTDAETAELLFAAMPQLRIPEPITNWLYEAKFDGCRAKAVPPKLALVCSRHRGFVRCAPCVATTLATGGNVNRNPLRVNPYYQSTDRSIALATFHPKSNIDAREQRWSWPSRLQSQRVAASSTNANCRYHAQSHDELSSS